MSGPTPTQRPARLQGIASVALALALAAALAACSSSATPPPSVALTTASPAAIVSVAPTASQSAEAASASPSSAASPSASPTSGGGRYGGGGATPTPAPTPKPTAKPTSKPTPTPTPTPVSIVVKTRSTGIGTVLVGPNGLTLYTLKSDPTNGSGCTGDCAANWPPFLVKTGTTIKGSSGVSGTFGSFARSGKRQVTYRGRALYYFSGDSYTGDTNGQGIGHVWYVAKP